jgi:hypothetical protein
MTINDYYNYLVRARRDMRAFLETMPDEALAKRFCPAHVLSASRI